MGSSENGVAATRRTTLLITFACAATVYGLTCAPGVLWQDSATFQYRVWFTDFRGDLGLALSHPLYIGLAKFFSLLPIGTHAFRVNLFSGLCAAMALTLLMDVLLSLTRSRPAATISVILLAVSHTFWKHAVIAEVMSLYGLGLIAELWLLEHFFRLERPNWLIAALCVNGLNTSNHLLGTLHLPAYVALFAWALYRRVIFPRHVLNSFIAYIVGLIPYLVLISAELFRGRQMMETLHSALFGDGFAKDVLNTSLQVVPQAARAAAYFFLNFPTPLLVAAPMGWLFVWRNPAMRWIAVFGTGVFVVDFLFAFRYPVADQYVFFLPCFIVWAAFTGPVVGQWIDRSRPALVVVTAFALLPMLVYEVLPLTLRRFNVSVPFRKDIPFRDAYAYFLRPRANGDHSAEQFARAGLAQAAPDGLLIADFTVETPVVYVRDVLGADRGVSLTTPCDIHPARPVVELAPDAVRPFAINGKAFIATNSAARVPTWVRSDYELVPAGAIFNLRPKS